MRECVRCLYREDHPFGLVLDAEGICSGCRTHEEKADLDEGVGLERLEADIRRAAAQHPQRTGAGGYDCVVPIRGTPEHFYVLDVLVRRLGLNPLVVVYNSQFNSRVGIRNVDRLREVFDVDLYLYTTNPELYRKFVRESLASMSSVRWPFLAGSTSLPVRVAVEKRIPVVVWPLHQPTEQAGVHGYAEHNRMMRRDRHEFDLLGVEPDDLLSTNSTLLPNDVEDLRYPSDRRLAATGVIGVHLSNYLPWDSRRFSEEMIDRHGALPARNVRTFDTYDRVDDMVYMTVHDLLKQRRVGYGRVTDSLCREIRFGRVDRGTALEVRDHFERQVPERELGSFLRWLGMRREALDWFLARLPHALPAGGPTTLSGAAEAFVSGFRSGPDVHETDDFILFGTGIDLYDPD